ncbi:response regulator transcription factor [Sporosarcina obsidiansis]|uniref:response regulator transcription factor n=1 Tax=Sporosarcina obsidiansis TaxID=2660748 RepID=UPI001891CA0D|nr:response regulator [Sporosarcina obsidiansis]
MSIRKNSEVIEGAFFRYVFNLLRANVLRDRRTMSLVLLREERGDSRIARMLKEKLTEMLREKDVLFETEHPDEIGLLLPNSGKEEAVGFLQRLQKVCPGMECGPFQAAILEVYHPELTSENALAICRKAMAEPQGQDGIHFVHVESGLDRPVLEVKVSILDGDRLFRELLQMAVERIDLAGVRLQVRTFADGLVLSQSDWTDSWHPHLVVMSDVLPKRNGLDVLHELRKMPNQEKFTILMMTRHNSEEDMIYAYESGTDGYLLKPFNLRLFEAQVKRMLAGLWS